VKQGVRILVPGVPVEQTGEVLWPGSLAREVEDRGFESMWFPEHTHVPVGEQVLRNGSPLPSLYQNSVDPLIGLAAAAQATTRLRIGTGICLISQREPLSLAKQVASLDCLSSGRVLFGVGYGWNRMELRNHGVPWPKRRDVALEHLQAVLEIWAEDVASFSGEHVTFSDSWSWPKPVQRPRPPIYIGARGSTKTFEDIVKHADGWLPIQVEDLGRVAELRRVAAEYGRDPDSIDVTYYGAREWDDRTRDMACEAGVSRVVHWVESGVRSDVLRRLDELAHG
jgi:probable F420-dependent oxidoreductase